MGVQKVPLSGVILVHCYYQHRYDLHVLQQLPLEINDNRLR